MAKNGGKQRAVGYFARKRCGKGSSEGSKRVVAPLVAIDFERNVVGDSLPRINKTTSKRTTVSHFSWR